MLEQFRRLPNFLRFATGFTTSETVSRIPRMQARPVVRTECLGLLLQRQLALHIQTELPSTHRGQMEKIAAVLQTAA